MNGKILAVAFAVSMVFFSSCGDDSGNSGPSKSGPAASFSSSSGDGLDFDKIVAIQNKTITGISQKGPFVNGASVIVQELNGKTLAQTGKSFRGKTSGDKGEFVVSNVSLESQYALLEVNGYYLNENTGAKSNGTIALNALVDVSKRENVNINLLTHLEYERALHLITTGKGVAAAKKQAEGEVFKAFGIAGDFANSEELNILAKGDGDAALLAISVLMQGDLSEAELSERLANFADDIEQDGTWEDVATKTQIADWTSMADLDAIRDIVEKWNAENKAPAFEQVVKAFWWNEYGLATCTVANDGEIKQDTNSLSINHNSYYVCDNGDWRMGTDSEQAVGFGCTASNIGEERRVAGYMTCSRPGVWIATTHTVAGTMTYDGQTYKTIGIGTQMWMAENLNYEYKVNGSTYGNWCYNNSADSCAKYGRLYTWGAAADSVNTECGFDESCKASLGKVQGICPNGWHLPSQTEWYTLFTALGEPFGGSFASSTAGSMLKTTEGWADSGNGSDAYGFSALPSGYRFNGDGNGNFSGVSQRAYFWSSSEATYGYAHCLYLSYNVDLYSGGPARLLECDKLDGASVRCVMD